MDRKQVVGLILIFLLFLFWTYNNAKIKQQMEIEKRTKDSIAIAEQQLLEDSLKIQPVESSDFAASEQQKNQENLEENTRETNAQLDAKYGSFASNIIATEQTYTLENEHLKITFSNKGGKIVDAHLKDYQKVVNLGKGNKEKKELHLLSNKKNRFNYKLPIKDIGVASVNTEDLVFGVIQEDNMLRFVAGDSAFVQTYRLVDDYTLDYTIDIDETRYDKDQDINLVWNNYLDKLELNTYFETMYSTVYFKKEEENSDYCNCRKNDVEEVDESPVEWFSHSNQFFNSSLMTLDEGFQSGVFETIGQDEKSSSLKYIKSEVILPATVYEDGKFAMQMYIGPNKYDKLRGFGNQIEEIIPFGRSIFGSINRWVIRPFFNFLDKYIGNKGLSIIIMIFIVKMLLYPLTYKMLHSQAKMGALKPEIENMKKKYKGDQQTQQVETMKMYREYGVSPLGGCMPMILQMPIWYALFRFFPASIGFRQESFLWADDLSSYDAILHFGFNIPMLGSHLSLFTILWVISQLVYTYYNSKHMDLSANPAMKYVQYLMPVMFLVFFNQYASGLTVYMFFSNLITIGQNILTKRFVFDESKLRAELMKNKSKPKKKSKFAERVEMEMKKQQAMRNKKKK